jgi:hypothetical protein
MTADHYARSGPRWALGAELVYGPIAAELVAMSPHPLEGRTVLDAGAACGWTTSSSWTRTQPCLSGSGLPIPSTPAIPDNATQILVARLDTDGHSFLACSGVPGGCRGQCQVDAGLDELDVLEAEASGRVIAGVRRSWR